MKRAKVLLHLNENAFSDTYKRILDAEYGPNWEFEKVPYVVSDREFQNLVDVLSDCHVVFSPSVQNSYLARKLFVYAQRRLSTIPSILVFRDNTESNSMSLHAVNDD